MLMFRYFWGYRSWGFVATMVAKYTKEAQMYKCMLAIAVLLTVANVKVAQGADLGETGIEYNAFVPPGDGSPDDTWGGGTRNEI